MLVQSRRVVGGWAPATLLTVRRFRQLIPGHFGDAQLAECRSRTQPNVVAVRGLATRLSLATMKQTLKDLDANSSVAVSKFGEC
jgi:hypothetical protein